MSLKEEIHHNLFEEEINHSLKYHPEETVDREIYCKKWHMVRSPYLYECIECPYLADLEQGHGRGCVWGDIEEEKVVRHEDRYKEYQRIDNLIQQKVVEPPLMDMMMKVKRLEYDDSKWIYKSRIDNSQRYVLGTKGDRPLICVGINPSTASPDDLDKTMKMVEKSTDILGCDSFIMLNIYSQRATDPKDMDLYPNYSEIKENMKYIKEVLKQGKVIIWAAWGVEINRREFLKECLKQIVDIANKHDCKWVVKGGVTNDGHPRHPSRLANAAEFEAFDIQQYLEQL